MRHLFGIELVSAKRFLSGYVDIKVGGTENLAAPNNRAWIVQGIVRRAHQPEYN